MKLLSAASLSTLVLLVAGCTSQNDAIDAPVVRDPGPTATMTPGGIFSGTLTFQNAGTQSAVTALIDEQQRLSIYANDASFLISGLYTTSSSGLNGQARQFNLADTTAAAQTETIVGSYDAKQRIVATYTRADGEAGTLTLNYLASDYEIASSTGALQGTWTNQDGFGAIQNQFNIDAGGGISGQTDAPKCSYYNGSLSVIDARYNVYNLIITESCTSAGGANVIQSMRGLATLLPAQTGTARPQTLVLSVASSTTGRLFRLGSAR